ncbi:hypothetical protein [Chondromyces crocatus]|uniref:Secreted protein n=1 Tax=Chondromyces crocatus TaxID=52 RepID=A0A0K1EA74_CHOCO|nr:hypothetical protein [Chondromyces crocatus]AKT37754.1 uncharacterized protein CMC5_018960 [Chondromyces crocatus]
MKFFSASVLRRVLVAAALSVVVAPVGCSTAGGAAGCSKGEGPSEATGKGVDLSPVPAPAGLIAEAFVASPESTWAKARTAVGGPALFLPVNVGTLVANVLGLPPTVASEIDGNVPVVGAVVDRGTAPAPGGLGVEHQAPRAVVGVHVKSGPRFVDQLTKGEAARYQARVDEATSITVLEPKSASPAGSAASEEGPGGAGAGALGVLGNYLLVAPAVADLTAVGPYVARTLSQGAAPKEDVVVDVPRAAIGGPILGAVREAWERVRPALEAGQASSLAATGTRWISLLGDMEKARVTLVLDEAAHLRFEATPRAGDGPAKQAVAEASVGDVKPLLELPADVLGGLLMRESAAGRQASVASQVGAMVRLLGREEREVPEKEKAQITSALQSLAIARGDWFAAGVRWEGIGPTAVARVAVADEGKLGGALEEFMDLTKLPSIKAYLKDEGLTMTVGKHVVERLPGEVRRIRFGQEKEGAKAAAKAKEPELAALPRNISFLHLLKDGALFASAGYEPDEGMRQIVAAASGPNLGGVPAMKAGLDALGSEVSFALFLDPLRLLAVRTGKPAPAESTPVFVAAGASSAGEGSLWGRLDVPTAVLREVVRRRGGL